MMPTFCTDPATLEQFRALLGIGMVLLSGILLVDYVRYMTRPLGKDEKRDD